MDQIRGSIKTISIDKAVWPGRWIRWNNILMLSTIMCLPLYILSYLLKGDPEGAIAISTALALLAFPGWIAWQNIDVIHSVAQKYTIRTLVFCGSFYVLCAGALVLAGMYGPVESPHGRESERFGGFLLGGNVLISGLLAYLAAFSLAKLRKQEMKTLGVRLGVLVAELKSLGTSHRPRQLKAQRPVLGWVLIVSAVAVWLAGDVFWPNKPASRDLSRLAFLLVVFARANFQPTATTLLRDDHRAPVLLLRSFLDDEKISWRNATRSFLDTSLESRLASHFARFGPFIAVGTPTEGVPVIGAARAQLGGADWKAQILAWIDQSRVILIMAGTSHWVNWELEQVIARQGVDKLIVCFPPIAGRWTDKWSFKFGPDMEARLTSLRGAFAGTIWAEALNRLDDSKTLRSVTFGSAGQITVVRAKSRDRNAYHLAVLVANWVMLRDSTAASGVASASRAEDWQSSTVLRARWAMCVLLLLLSAVVLVSGAGSEYAPALMPIGLATLLMALVINPVIRLRTVYYRHAAMVLRTAWTAAVLLAAHGVLVISLQLFAELSSGSPNNKVAALGFTAMKYPAYAGSRYANAWLGEAYLFGKGVQKSVLQAIPYYEALAASGNTAAAAEAAYNLGVIALNGLDMPVDEQAAGRYFEQSARGGHHRAELLLGLMLAQGDHLPQDIERARVLLTAARSSDDPEVAAAAEENLRVIAK